MLRDSPHVVWKYIAQIEESCRGASPNDGHRAIARLQEKYEVWVLTQNVDSFHQGAGSKNVIAIHGDVHGLVCTGCSYTARVEDYSSLEYCRAGTQATAGVHPKCPEVLPLVAVTPGEERRCCCSALTPGQPPPPVTDARLRQCNSLVRPTVVLFDEELPDAALTMLQQQLRKGFDAVFSVGTSSIFPYIAAPVLQAKALGRLTVEVNPEETHISEMVDHRARNAASFLSKLADRLVS